MKELDKALREGTIDISVHSLKDMPSEVPEDLPVGLFQKRSIGRCAGSSKGDFSRGRYEQEQAHRQFQSATKHAIDEAISGFTQKSVRGNVLTRLEKLDRGDYCALILARAGLQRLGLEDRISKVFTSEEMVPAAGRGIMVVQGRKGEDYSFGLCG